MSTRCFILSAAAAVAATIAGCSSANPPSQPSLAVQGTVSKTLAVESARAVAIGSDGRTFWADLDAQRDFTLWLPVGQSYRIVIASVRGGIVQEKVGHLVLQASSGSSLWLGANQPGTVDLGVLKLTSQHGGGGDDDDDHEGDHDHDNDCHQGGHHGDGVCGGDHDEPLEPTKQPGSKCDDHDHHCHHHDGGKADCGKDHDHDDDDHCDDDDQPCPSGDAGAPKDAGHAGDAGDGGGLGVGGDCISDADCMAGLTCKAGLCSQ
jgi:hypothetical protein